MGGDKSEKITIMVLKVDLQCSRCYKKVKKILCKFPQIRDQMYDEKANIVTISVFCCNPEKIRDKLCCKGGGVIKSIEIKEPPKPKVAEKPKEPEKPKVVVEKPKEPEKPKVVVVQMPKEPEKPKVVEKPKEPEKPKQPAKPKEPEKPKEVQKPKEPEKPKQPEKPKEAPKPTPVAPPRQPQPQPQFPPAPEPVIVMPIQGYPHQPPPGTHCCGQCYEGYTGGPCYDDWYGRREQPPPPPPGPCYDTHSYGYAPGPEIGPGPGPATYGLPKGCYVNKCDYFSEDNASGCSIM
ncbi:pollen-specific leucine-rich repeat extensin-like protein 1 [Solanum dulcamara]|uniref:pollen-specific leucine-rich repeat extensin-like protein 1 n=1 Tax=Solanum dulcamara TaxID=45834 RepID=UPI0024863893|nr:pollen-specific leucine-rich repeat extensin-like protein 1 [Solanum dulcamara]